MNPSAASTAADGPQQSPASVEFTLGNTYRLLDESEASFDKLTGTHSKIHDWALYIDVLPGSDPDFIDRVAFEMQDKSFVKSSFTCHSPIRIRSNVGSAYLGKISGARNNNNSQEKQIGQDTEEKPEDAPSMSSRPHGNLCRWRFSTRQQTYGAVDVQISIRGRGGSKLTIPYRIVLNEGGNESYPTMVFVEKRPNHALKPMKMMNVKYILEMNFGLDQGISTSSALYESAKSVFSRSKIPIRVLSEDGNSEEFGFAKKKSAASTAWSFKLDYSPRDKIEQLSREHDVLSISSPNLSGGHGLNECYKIIEGLPWHCNVSSLVGSLHVRIDVSSTLSIEQLVKLCMNFIKYEESVDSFMPSHRRDDHCCDCRSNKHHIKGGNNNKERNNLLSKCKTVQELVDCMNSSKEQCYKLNLSCLVELGYIEFRQHESSKDKTTVTNWIRFCAAFVKNSARLRSPLSLKETTSIEEEFDLLFEYVVKDRALRNFYRDRRDSIEAQERERQVAEAAVKESSDEMSISDGSCSEESTHTDRFKRLRTT